MTRLLTIGVPELLTQNVIYALPARMCRLFCDALTPTLEVSNTEAMTADVNLTLSDGAAIVSGGFIRCASGNVTVMLKAAA